MIVLTRLNGDQLVVNALQIESIEHAADTRVTLMNGKQLFVRETPADVVDLVAHWLARIHRGDIDVREGGL